jgi:hypothetical protein
MLSTALKVKQEMTKDQQEIFDDVLAEKLTVFGQKMMESRGLGDRDNYDPDAER